MIITSQNWDGVTAPALPAGWTFGSGFATTTAGGFGATPLSASNMLTQANTGTSVAYYDTPDSSSGNVTVTAAFTTDEIVANFTLGYVFARGTNPGTPGTASYYYAEINFGNNTVYLAKVVSGTPTTLASLPGVSLVNFGGSYGGSPNGAWFQIQLICNGVNIAVNVQRLSDGKWLQSDGTWGAAPVNCLTAADSSISGSGLAGVVMEPANTGSGEIYSDNFVFATIDNINTMPNPRVVRARPLTPD